MKNENSITKYIQENELAPETSKTLQELFNPLFEQADEWVAKAKEINVTDCNQTREMAVARQVRLALRDIRVNTEKVRKTAKEESLRKGKAIDGIANVIKYLIEPIEEHLEKQEKFVELQEEKRKDELRDKRVSQLEKYELDLTVYDLRNMTEETFTDLVKSQDLLIEQRQKAEAERIAKEKAEAEERERMRIENEKLKKQAAEAEAEAKKVKAEQDEKLRKEREEKERLEKELKAKEEKELKAKKEAQILAKKQAAAPDKEKLITLAKTIGNLELPKVTSEEAKKIIADTKTLLNKVSKFLKDKSEEL